MDGLVDNMKTLAFDPGEQELWKVLSRERCDLTWVFTGSFPLHVGGKSGSWETSEEVTA